MSPSRQQLSPRSGWREQVGEGAERKPRSTLALLALGLAALVLFSGFAALGTWQIYRRSWKLDLIARVEQRVHAPAVPVPPPSAWAGLTAANSEYRHVKAAGTFLNDRETLVQATTELGAGYWVLTPLRMADGTVVLVNRGFVPPERRDRAAHGAAEPTTPANITGLLRMTEPRGAFLRHNDPGADRWYSRDVQAIAAARGLGRVAPYFIDAEAAGGAVDARAPGGRRVESEAMGGAVGTGAPGGAVDTRVPGGRAGGVAGADVAHNAPVAGLTIIKFHNSHLVYVITWYTLALMVVAGMWILLREERRLRRRAGTRGGAP